MSTVVDKFKLFLVNKSQILFAVKKKEERKEKPGKDILIFSLPQTSETREFRALPLA